MPKDGPLDTLGHRGHGLAIEHIADSRAVDGIPQLEHLLDGLQKVGLDWAEGFQQQLDPKVFTGSADLSQRLGSPVKAAPRVLSISEIPLLRGAEDHDLAAEIAAESSQGLQIAGGAVADGRVVGGQVQSRRRDQEPVEADNLEAGVLGLPAELRALVRADLLDGVGGVEGGDLDAVKACHSDLGYGLAQRRAENLAAESVFESHGPEVSLPPSEGAPHPAWERPHSMGYCRVPAGKVEWRRAGASPILFSLHSCSLVKVAHVLVFTIFRRYKPRGRPAGT